MLPLHHLRKWSQRRELNPHLSAYEAAALPLSYAAVDSRVGIVREASPEEKPTISGFADRRLPAWLPGDLVETWRIELQPCNRPFVGFGAVDTSRIPT
jgi:hypothetical protein